MKLTQWKQFLQNKDADIRMIGAVIGIMVTLLIGILVFYNVTTSLDHTTIDAEFGPTSATPAWNASNATLDHAATFFQVAPIIGIVIVAVVVLGYVGRIGG